MVKGAKDSSEKVDEIKERYSRLHKFKRIKESFNAGKERGDRGSYDFILNNHDDPYKSAKRAYNYSKNKAPKEEVIALELGYAKRRLENAIRDGNISYVISATKVFEKAGRANKRYLHKKLINFYEQLLKNGKDLRDEDTKIDYYVWLKKFLKRNDPNNPTYSQSFFSKMLERVKQWVYTPRTSTEMPSQTELTFDPLTRVKQKYQTPEKSKAAKPSSTKSLEHKVAGSVAVVLILTGLFFTIPSLTGNAIGNLLTNTNSTIGIALLIVGLLLGLYWVRRK